MSMPGNPIDMRPQLTPSVDTLATMRRFIIELANMPHTLAGNMMLEENPSKLIHEVIRAAKSIQTKGDF